MSGEFKLVSLLNPQVVLTAGPAMSAGTQSQNTGTISFANSNGVSFGMNNGTITATVVAGAAAGIGAIGAGTNTATSGTVTFGSSAGNVTFGMNPAGYITASAPAGGGAATVFSNSNNVSFGLNGSTITATASFPAQTAYVFSNGNGVSFGTNGSTVTATVKTDYQSAGAYLTTAMASDAGSNFVGLNSALTGNGVSATINSSGISLNVPAFLTTAAATDITTNAVALSNSSLFQQTSATSAITSNAAHSTHSHGAVSLSLGGGLNGTYSSASSGFTLSLTQVAGGGADGYNQAAFTNSTANSTQTLVWAGNSNGSGNITFGLTGSTVTASAPSGGGGGAGLSAGTQSVSTGTVAFANSNGISFGMSGSNQITASYTVPTIPGATVFSNSNNVSFGLNGSTVTATATWPAQTVQPAVAQLNGSSGTMSLVAGSSLSASSNASTITIGLASNWSTTIMPLGNSTGYASSVLSNTFLTTAAQSGHSHGNPILALTNLSGTTGSASNGFTLSLSAAAPGGGGVAISAGSDSLFTSGTVSFGNANGFSFITSNGSIVGSYTDGGGAGGGFSAGISNLGNTANSSGTVASHIVFVGSNNITLAESVNANSATVTISGPNLNTWAIQQWPGALVGSTGSLTIISPGATTTTAGGSITTESVYLFPIVIPAQLEYNNVHVVQALAAPAAGTGSVTQIQAYALYSSNASTYSLMTDNSYVNIQYRSQNSVTAQSISMFFGTNSTTNTYTTNGNISASISGTRGASLTSGTGVSTIPAGSYLLAAAVLQSSAGGIAIQTLAHKQWIQHAFKEQPYGKAAQYQPWARHSGYITHTHSATYTPVIVFPNSFHISNISSATIGGNGVPLVNFVRTDYPT